MTIRICPKCNGKVSSTRDDCPHCGYIFPVNKKCPECEEFIPIDSKECPVCGYYFTAEKTKPIEEVKSDLEPKNQLNDTPIINEDINPTVNYDLDEEKQTCPYCNSNTPLLIGNNYYLCMTCKMKYFNQNATSFSIPKKETVINNAIQENNSSEDISEENKEIDKSTEMQENEIDSNGKAHKKANGSYEIITKIKYIFIITFEITTVAYIITMFCMLWMIRNHWTAFLWILIGCAVMFVLSICLESFRYVKRKKNTDIYPSDFKKYKKHFIVNIACYCVLLLSLIITVFIVYNKEKERRLSPSNLYIDVVDIVWDYNTALSNPEKCKIDITFSIGGAQESVQEICFRCHKRCYGSTISTSDITFNVVLENMNLNKGDRREYFYTTEWDKELHNSRIIGNQNNFTCYVDYVKYSTGDIVSTGGYAKHYNSSNPETIINKIYFGKYPQTLVTNSYKGAAFIEDLNDMAGTKPTSYNSYKWTDYGYYINSEITSYMFYQDIDYDKDGAYDYRGVYFTQYRPSYCSNSSSINDSRQSDNGYKTDTIYWFKYDSIEWEVVDEKDEKKFIVANLVLDSQDYYPLSSSIDFEHNGGIGSSNNYELSNIRKWLNDNFYNTAFNDLQKGLIETTTVDNSVESTGQSPNQYVCDDTEDKVFLLSDKEVSKYFTSDSSRKVLVTDYARSQGVNCGSNHYEINNKEWHYCSQWWLRSPSYSNGAYIWCVGDYGKIGQIVSNYSTCTGVRPAMWIKTQ